MRLPLVVGAFLLGAFLVLGAVVSGAPPWIDVTVAHALGGGWQARPGAVAAAISVVLGPLLPYACSVFLIGMMVVSRRRRQRGTTWLLARCFVLLWLCRAVSVFKPLYRRERPRPYPDYAYPSGHVVSVACVAFDRHRRLPVAARRR